MKILIVEDDIEILDSLSLVLENNNYIVEKVDNGKKALQMLLINKYDVCLLDINLPYISGIEIIKTIRKKGIHIPIIFITAKSQLNSKLEAFDLGADDYIVKPFHIKEVLVRINSVIRRASFNPELILKLGDWEIYPDKLSCVNNNMEIRISNKEMQLLTYLLRNKNKYISSEEILEHVWNSDFNFFSDTVKTHIKNLRNKLDKDKRYIKTSKGKGYGIFD